MFKRIVSEITLIMLLVSILTLAFNIQPTKASGTIYIKADGSVEPHTAPILSVDNVTYTFTDNINEEIVVERDDIVVDGAGYTVGGTFYGTGIALSGRRNVTIKNMEIRRFWVGIALTDSSNNSISNNNITANGFIGIPGEYGAGLFLILSSNNSITRNNVTNNDYGIGLVASSSNSIVGNNIANDWYGIILGGASNNSIYHNNFVNNTRQVVGSTSGYANAWDKGYPSGGNYWSDYKERYPNATEIDDSGIWDTPYVIDADNRDRYPLINSWSPLLGDVNADGIVDLLDLVTAADAFGAVPGSWAWNPLADIYPDGCIDIFDLVMIALRFGQHY